MHRSASCAARPVDSVEDLIDAVVDHGLKVRVGQSEAVAPIGLVAAVRLWVQAADDAVEVTLAGGVLEFRNGSGRCWLENRARFRGGSRRGHLRRRAEPASECYLCNEPLSPQIQQINVDHWYPRGLGGPDEPWNLRLVHKSCNHIKADMVLPEAQAAYLQWVERRDGSAAAA